MNETPILLTRQRHEAKRAGMHYDVRIVIGDKAFSWATKKEMPTPGKPILLFEQPTHTASYALSKHIVIPDGQYGAGETFLDFAQKGKAQIHDDAYHLDLNNGDRYLIKKMPEHYGDKAWLFLKKKDVEKVASISELVAKASYGNDEHEAARHKLNSKRIAEGKSPVTSEQYRTTYLSKAAASKPYEQPTVDAKSLFLAGGAATTYGAAANAKSIALDIKGGRFSTRAYDKMKNPAMSDKIRTSMRHKVVGMNSKIAGRSKLYESLGQKATAVGLGLTIAGAGVNHYQKKALQKKASLYDDMVNHRAALRSEAHQMYPDHWQGEAPRSLWNKAHEMVKEDTTVDDEGNADVPDINPYLARLMRRRHVSAGIEETYGNNVVDHADNLAHNNAGIKSFGAALAGGAVGAASGFTLGALGAMSGMGYGKIRDNKLMLVAGGIGGAVGAISSASSAYSRAKEKGLVSANAYLENKYNPYADKAKNFI